MIKWRNVFFAPLAFLLVLLSCDQSQEGASIERWKDEITQAEVDFAMMAEKEGVEKAFVNFAAQDAVLLRNNTLVKGKDAIRQLYGDRFYRNAELSWQPDYVDVSTSGDLGYTYGRYRFSYQDSTGQEVVHEGIFHTVWKRQSDGSWRFVWD